jgi:hypothetical protein
MRCREDDGERRPAAADGHSRERCFARRRRHSSSGAPSTTAAPVHGVVERAASSTSGLRTLPFSRGSGDVLSHPSVEIGVKPSAVELAATPSVSSVRSDIGDVITPMAMHTLVTHVNNDVINVN